MRSSCSVVAISTNATKRMPSQRLPSSVSRMSIMQMIMTSQLPASHITHWMLTSRSLSAQVTELPSVMTSRTPTSPRLHVSAPRSRKLPRNCSPQREHFLFQLNLGSYLNYSSYLCTEKSNSMILSVLGFIFGIIMFLAVVIFAIQYLASVWYEWSKLFDTIFPSKKTKDENDVS